MLKTQALVLELCRLLELPYRTTAGLDKMDFKRLRNLVREEAAEFEQAMACLERALHTATSGGQAEHFAKAHADAVHHYWAEVIDAICDIIVVLHNTANAMGVDIEPFFDEVHRTNLAKWGGPIRPEDGKRLKPSGWQPPRIKEMLEELLAKEGSYERTDQQTSGGSE